MYFCAAGLEIDQTKGGQMLYTLFLTAAACAAILGVMVLVYGTVRWMQYT